MTLRPLVAFFAIILFAAKANATIVYVDSANIAGSQLGTSWATAYYSFEYGVQFSNPGDSIFVAKGTYSPNSGYFYTMKENVKIFGGFLNTDINFSQRNPTTRRTVLKGDLNSVIRNDSILGITPLAVLDGFIITRGMAPSSKAGGGMYNRYASPTITNCIFYRNYTSSITHGGGGGMYNDHSSPLISSCEFIEDTVRLFISYPPNATGEGEGAAMNNVYSSPVITNCRFTNNVAIQASGGALAFDNNSSPVITFCTFDQNKCIGGLSVSYMGGGAIYQVNGGQLYLDSCTFKNNVNAMGSGAIEATSTLLTMKRCIFQNNTCTSSYFGGGALRNENLTAGSTIDSCYFNGNTSSLNGGAIFNTNTSIQITNSTFYRNRSVESGGGIYNYTSLPVINACTFLQNRASANAANTSFGNNCFGGAIYTWGTISDAPHSIVNCSFTKDTAAYGGAIYLQTNVNYTVDNCTFSQNVANASGGGVLVNNNSNSVVPQNSRFANSSFTANRAVTGGAMMFQGRVRTRVDSSSFTGNVATFSGTSSTLNGGGAIYNYSTDTILVNGSTFSSNRARNGGAWCTPSFSGFTYGFIYDCDFNNNDADSLGGAIAGAMGSIYRTSFTADTARYGGGIYGGGYPIMNCRIEANKARRGGGLFCIDSTTLANCIIVKNIADSLGGGMYNSKPPRVTSTTFANNKAYVSAGAIYNTNFGSYTDSSFTNCIVSGNNSGVFNQNTSNSVFSYSLVQGLGAFPIKRLLDGAADPKFVDTNAGNYQLLITSPCIDTGKNTAMPLGIVTDYAGNVRILNGKIDLGAYEGIGTPLSLDQYKFNGYIPHKQTAFLDLELSTENVRSFELEKSTNGTEFSKVYDAINDGRRDFRYVDEFLGVKNFYRIRFAYHDGSSTYSNTVVLVTNAEKDAVYVYPNPVKGQLHVNVDGDKHIGEQLSIYDAIGKLIMTQIVYEKVTLIDVSGLSNGVYFIKGSSSSPVMFCKE